jgi:hypothetical protein
VFGTSPWPLLGSFACAMACGGEAQSTPAEQDRGERPEEFVEACRLWCGLALALQMPCEPGAAMRHGVRLGSGEVPTEPPVSDDPECNAQCQTWPGRSDCWRQLSDYYACAADALWICPPDGSGWQSGQCGFVGDDPAVCWEE